MALKKELVGSGVWGGTADAIGGSVGAIAAYSGGGQTNATLITTAVVTVATVGAAADSIKLPVASAGDEIWVRNNHGTNSMNVFPQSGGKINNGSADAALACAAGKTLVFKCIGGVDWIACLTA